MHALHIHTLAWFLTALRPSCPPAFHATATQDASRPIKGKPTGTSLKDLGFGEVGMDEGWAACPPKPGPHPHGRDPSVDPRAAMPRTNVSAPGFPIGGGKTTMMHRQNKDGSISPVVDPLVFPDMKRLVDQVHAKGLKAGWCACARGASGGDWARRARAMPSPSRRLPAAPWLQPRGTPAHPAHAGT